MTTPGYSPMRAKDREIARLNEQIERLICHVCPHATGRPDEHCDLVEGLTLDVARWRNAVEMLFVALDYTNPGWREETLVENEHGDEVNSAWMGLFAMLERNK